jgi:hypothetical protein
VRYEGSDPAWAKRYPRGEDRIHGAFGVGLAFSRAQLDFGLDFASGVAALSISGVVSF